MKRAMGSSFVLVLALIAMALLVTSCGRGQAGSSGKQTTITYLGESYYVDKFPGSTYITGFEQKYPNIKFKAEGYGFDQVFQVIEVKMAAGSKDYDVIQVDAPNISAYTFRNYLLPLDKYFSKDEINQFIPADIAGSTVNGHYMAAPLFTSCVVLLYNKSLLQAGGVSFPSEDPMKRMTWEDLVAASQKIMKAVDPAGKKGIQGLMIEQVNRPYQTLTLPNSLGAPSIGQDSLTVDGIINSPQWIKAAQFYSDLFNKYKVSFRGVTPDEAPQDFMAGKIAFFVGGTWDVTPSIKAGISLGYAPHPYFKDGKPVSPTGAWHLGIAKPSAHPDSAAAFVRYMTIGDGSTPWVDQSGMIPARISELNRIGTDPKYAEFPGSVFKIAAYEQKNTAIARPVTPGFNEYDSILTSTFEDIRNGEVPQTALNKAVQQIDTALQKYR